MKSRRRVGACSVSSSMCRDAVNPSVSSATVMFMTRIRRTGVDRIASRSSGTSRWGITEVNQEPDPSTIASACRTAATASGWAGGFSGTNSNDAVFIGGTAYGEAATKALKNRPAGAPEYVYPNAGQAEYPKEYLFP